ncbi:plant UBX domain-containing protein 7 [Sorghum bicolor]|nr:plant UBX domain-containing protein 7 [Sorghum bicolor]XP_021308412.1 plant UBX domain-containing protein 7 [Sorghum bicolor]|eukprot:XP_002461860.1 plant UBX domain-containing protein 7 [Sorghum bicolor]
MEDEAALVAAFMNSTGCGREDALNRLASSGGHLGRALNSFFSSGAGPSSGSGRRRSRSPPPPSSLQVSSSEEEEDAVRARPPAPVPARRTRVSRWDSKTRVERRSKSSRRRERRRRCRRDRPRESGTTNTAGGDRAADDNRSHRRRFREFREDILSDGEEDEETNNSSRRRRRFNPTELTSHSEDEKKAADDNNSRRRRRLNPTELTPDSEDEKKADDNNENVIDVSSDDGDNDDDDDYMQALEEAARPARQPALPPPHPRNRTFEELFKVPHSLTFKGGFHDAKVHAARRARWLLANVQSSEELPLPSLHQNRDVWGNALVAQCVRDRFVLWHADADADAADDGEGEEEAKKVLGYYDIPHDKLPVVVVVDPVTGQAMDVLHGSAACEFNDFMVRLGPFTDMKPTIPVAMAKRSTTSVSPGEQSSIRPATTTTAPTSSSERAAGNRQQAPTTTTTVMRKPPDDAVVVAAAAVAPTCEDRQEHAPTTTTTTVAVTTEPVVAPCAGQQAESVEEKVCKVRVRLADGRVVTKEFGSQCAVAALFAYCRSMLGAGGAPPPEKPFRLMRFVGRATEEIGDHNQNASFESLGLHLTTVSVHLG